MIRRGLSSLICFLVFTPGLCAADLTISLEAKVGDRSRTAATETVTPGEKAKPRGALELRTGESVTIHWTVTSAAKQGVTKDVLVHVFVVKEEKAGQTTVPKLDKDVAVESALTMDFKPRDKSKGEATFQIDAPGAYLLRLETMDATTHVADHFAALDLIIK